MRSMPAAGLVGSRRTPLVLAPRVWHNRAKEAAGTAGAHHQHLSAQQSLDRAQVLPKRPVLLVPVTGQALHKRQQQCEQVF